MGEWHSEWLEVKFRSWPPDTVGKSPGASQACFRVPVSSGLPATGAQKLAGVFLFLFFALLVFN